MGTIIKREGRRGTSYRVQLRRHGRILKNQSDSLSKTFKTYSEARKWMIEQEALIEKNPVAQVPHHPTIYTLHDAIVCYEQEVVPYKAASTQHTERAGRRYFDEHLGHILLTHLTGSMLNACITDVMKTHKLSTSKRYFALINGVLPANLLDNANAPEDKGLGYNASRQQSRQQRSICVST